MKLKKRSLLLAALALLLLGVAGSAYLNPAFAATCTSAYATGASWVQRQADASETAFTSSKANGSYQAGLRKSAEWRQKLNQKAADPLPKKKPPATVAAAPAASRQQAQAQAPPLPKRAQAASLSAGQPLRDGIFTLQFTREEVAVLGNALNEALEALDDWEVETRMGCSKAEAERLLSELGRIALS